MLLVFLRCFSIDKGQLQFPTWGRELPYKRKENTCRKIRMKSQKETSLGVAQDYQPEKTDYISRRHHWFLREMTSEELERAQKFHTDDASLLRSAWEMFLIGRAAREICFNQSEALPRSWQKGVISMEFLRSFLRRHFAEKPVVASRNVK